MVEHEHFNRYSHSLIQVLSDSLKILKAGSLVVSCSDVSLKLALFSTLENDGVYVGSVPAPVSKADY